MEKGISYGPPMVAAKLARRKLETRRLLPDSLIINQEPGRYKCHGIDTNDQGSVDKPVVLFEDLRPEITPWIDPIAVPYAVGDWLYTKEVWRTLLIYNSLKPVEVPDDAPIWYDADGPAPAEYGKYRYARFMPKKFARFWDEVTAVRCERVQDITEEAAIAEGIPYESANCTFCVPGWPTDAFRPSTARIAYSFLWNDINGAASWGDNPWVFVIQFKELSRTGYPKPTPAPFVPVDTEAVAEATADSAAEMGGIALTEELQTLFDKHPGQQPAVLAGYELGLGDLREVLGSLDKPRQPGQRQGHPNEGRCINDLPGPLVRILNVAVAAQHLSLWLPMAMQYFKGDELRLLRFIEPHLVAFQNRMFTALAERKLFKQKENASAMSAARSYAEEMADVLSECLGELNSSSDPRRPWAAMRMYNELDMVGAVPETAELVEEMEAAHA